MDIDGYKLCALGYIGYVMPSAHGPFFVVRSSEKKSKRGSDFFLDWSQRTRIDFQSVATFMIVLIMKLMPQIGWNYALFINTGITL